MWENEADLISSQEEHEATPALVVVVPSAADWQRVLHEGWYRIPIRRAPQRIGAQYLAFYHTTACGEALRWSIQAYAPVRGYRLATRRELVPSEPDHPRADERYYCLALGTVQWLPRAIPSRKLRRVTFIPTTLERLFAADEINDLWLRDSAQQRYRRAFTLGEAGVPYLPVGTPTKLGRYSAMMPGT